MTTAEPTEQRSPVRWVDGTMPAMQERVQDIPVVGFIDYCLRGIGQVVFMNSPITGLFILAAMWIYDPWVGFAGTIGVIASTLAGTRAGYRSWRSSTPDCTGSTAFSSGWRWQLFLDPRLGRARHRVDHRAERCLLGADGCAGSRVRWSVGECPRSRLAFNTITLLFLDHRTARGARATRCRWWNPRLRCPAAWTCKPPCGGPPTPRRTPTRWRS